MKKYIFLTFLLFSFFINAEIYWFFGFDNNYYLTKTQFSVADSPFTIKTDSLDNILFAVLIDNHLNSNLFYGSDDWNVSHRTVSLHTSPSKFLLNSTFSFGDIISETSTITFDSIRMMNSMNTFDNKVLSIAFDVFLFNNDIIKSIFIPENTCQIPEYNILKNILNYNTLNHELKYNEALLKIRNCYLKFPTDRSLLKQYIYALMNIGKFGESLNILNDFYKNCMRDDFYFSLKMNIHAISGNFKNAEKAISEGRLIFPDSDILLIDAYNLYSITDSIKAISIESILIERDITF
ncbi:hypothetical protein KAU15_07145 [candidate division WOR-3 bacterium]|nr:hypothetical protein [candidate division WOR-3 bacterium]